MHQKICKTYIPVYDQSFQGDLFVRHLPTELCPNLLCGESCTFTVTAFLQTYSTLANLCHHLFYVLFQQEHSVTAATSQCRLLTTALRTPSRNCQNQQDGAIKHPSFSRTNRTASHSLMGLWRSERKIQHQLHKIITDRQAPTFPSSPPASLFSNAVVKNH